MLHGGQAFGVINSIAESDEAHHHLEIQVHGHNLDWRRFVSDMHIDFYKSEIAPIREITRIFL